MKLVIMGLVILSSIASYAKENRELAAGKSAVLCAFGNYVGEAVLELNKKLNSTDLLITHKQGVSYLKDDIFVLVKYPYVVSAPSISALSGRTSSDFDTVYACVTITKTN